MAKPSISVIISTYNSELWLEKVLWSYEAQTFKDFEIVIASSLWFSKSNGFKFEHF